MNLLAKLLEAIAMNRIRAATRVGSDESKELHKLQGEAGRALSPSIKRLAATANHIATVSTDLIDLSLNAVELLTHVPQQVVERSLVKMKQRWPSLDEKQTQVFFRP